MRLFFLKSTRKVSLSLFHKRSKMAEEKKTTKGELLTFPDRWTFQKLYNEGLSGTAGGDHLAEKTWSTISALAGREVYTMAVDMSIEMALYDYKMYLQKWSTPQMACLVTMFRDQYRDDMKHVILSCVTKKNS
jgi:hypothetical protein